MFRWLFILAVAAVIFTIYAVADCAFFDRTRIRGLRRGWWIVVIIFVPIIGALLWFIIGRGRAGRVGRGGSSRTVAPDDDAEFLRQLRNDAEQDERIRRLEQELAALDADDPLNQPKPGRKPGRGADKSASDGFDAGNDTLDTDRKHPETPDAPGEAGPSGRPNG
jgi:hypothetical protein